MDAYSSDAGGRGKPKSKKPRSKKPKSRSTKSRSGARSKSRSQLSKWMKHVIRTLASMKREKKANSRKAAPTLARAMKRAKKTYKA